MAGPQTVRIFLSSPGDVATDRDEARKLLLGLASGPFVRGHVHIDVVSWDDPHGGATMDARLTPQQAVDRSLPTPGECDLTVVLLWGRMGRANPRHVHRTGGSDRPTRGAPRRRGRTRHGPVAGARRCRAGADGQGDHAAAAATRAIAAPAARGDDRAVGPCRPSRRRLCGRSSRRSALSSGPVVAARRRAVGFIRVDAGRFIMGSDPQADRDTQEGEQPQHFVDLPAYCVARYPVTLAQFRAFVDDSGFAVGDPDCLRGVPNHPVVGVSFHAALTYCRWLTDRLKEAEWTPPPLREQLAAGWVMALPSEAEWERRHEHRTGESTLGSRVQRREGQRPRENLGAPDDLMRVLRGGSFDDTDFCLRAAVRNWFAPDVRYGGSGFRLVSSRLRP